MMKTEDLIGILAADATPPALLRPVRIAAVVLIVMALIGFAVISAAAAQAESFSQSTTFSAVMFCAWMRSLREVARMREKFSRARSKKRRSRAPLRLFSRS